MAVTPKPIESGFWRSQGLDPTLILAIMQGRVTGYRIMRGIGEREGAGSGVGEDVWRGNDLSSVPSALASHVVIPAPADAGEQMTVISESDADNGATATGALTVKIDYLDASGDEQQTTVTMNGQTAVDLTPSDVRFVQSMHVATVGSNTVAEGNIRIYKKSDAALVYNMIAATGNQSMVPHRMVPRGKTLYVVSWVPSESQGKRVAVRLRADCTDDLPSIRQAQVFLFKSSAYINKSTPGEIPVAVQVPALSVVKASAFPDTIGSDISVSWWGILVDD